MATYVILHRMLSLLISLSPSGGLTRVWQIMPMLILARTHLLDGCGTTGRRIREKQQHDSHSESLCVDLMAHLCIVMIHREVADQPGVWVILIVGQDLSHGGQVQHVPLGCRPHPLQHRLFSIISDSTHHTTAVILSVISYLVRLINNRCIFRQCLHDIEVLNGGWKRKRAWKD